MILPVSDGDVDLISQLHMTAIVVILMTAKSSGLMLISSFGIIMDMVILYIHRAYSKVCVLQHELPAQCLRHGELPFV
jgi:hypothetical protein